VLSRGRQERLVFEKGGWDFLRCPTCGLVSITPLPSLEAKSSRQHESHAEGGYEKLAAADGATIARRQARESEGRHDA
jgi:hypothetical protein